MLPQSGHIAELKIDNLDLGVLRKFHNIAGSFDGHSYFLHEGEDVASRPDSPSRSGMAPSMLNAANAAPDNPT